MSLEAGNHEPSEGRRLMKFDPTINTGTIIQIGTIIVMGATTVAFFQGELKTQKVELEAVKLAAERDNKRNEEALREIKVDVRELQKSINDIKEGVAILRGRAADVGSKR